MPIVTPFRGLLFSASRVPELERVIAPPAGSLTAEARALLQARSPHHIVHLEPPQGNGPTEPGRPEQAAELLAAWRREGVLEQDIRPAFYVAALKYRARGMPERTLWGVLARMRLGESATSSPDVRLLEAPDDAARAEILQWALALRTHVAPVLALHSDPGGEVARLLEDIGRRPADRWATDDSGLDLRLWRVADRGLVRSLGVLLEPLPIWIAEGVDRYAASRDLRDRLRSENSSPAPPGTRSYDHALAFLTALESPGLTLAPWHRVLKGARRFNARSLAGGPAAHLFELKHFSFDGFDHRGEQIRRRLREAATRGRIAIAVYAGGADFSLYLLAEHASEGVLAALAEPLRKADVAVLEVSLLVWARGIAHVEEGSAAVHLADSVERAMALVDSGDGSAAFLLNAPSREGIAAIAESGLTLPHRSITMLPRVPSGLVLDPLDPVDEVHALPEPPQPLPSEDDAE